MSIYTLLGKKHNLSDWQFWLASLFTAFQLIAAQSSACKTDNSWIAEHENNDEHIFVTTVD